MALFEGGIVRYKRTEEGVPKNCLFAKEDEATGNIFFGISRCNLKADVCKKATGRQIAREYSEFARASLKDPQVPIVVAGNGRYGKCLRHLFPLVLNFFYGIP